jgi:hypothetical protein
LTNTVGGQYGIFTFFVAFTLIFVSGLVLIIKKRRKYQHKFNKYNKTIIEDLDPTSLVVKREESSAKAEFIIEDLPYH